MDTSTQDPLVGRLVADRYRVIRLLAQGDTGQLYLAEHATLERRLALKVLPREFATGGLWTRFQQEARNASRIVHPNVPDIFDYGQLETGEPFVAVEFLEGHDLSEVLAKAFLDPASAIAIALEICQALAAAHSQGVVHRDLTPHKVFLQQTKSGGQTVKVLDLGIGQLRFAKAESERTRGHRMQAGVRLGAPEYMAPEQVAGLEGDRRIDVYAVGVIVFELLTGKVPFSGNSSMATLSAILNDPPPQMLAVNPQLAISADLQRVVMQALAKNPEERYASMTDFASAILRTPEGQSAARPFGGQPEASHGPEAMPPVSGPAFPGVQTEVTVPRLDDNVQVTVFRPRAVRPEVWYPMLAFAHLSERRPDAPEGEPDPVEEVERQAHQALGAERQRYEDLTQDAREAVPREGLITFVPEVEGFRFNPPSRSFRWLESVHREEFRICAAAALDGTTARGRLTVYLGSIILADVSLSIRVDAREPEAVPATPLDRAMARFYRKIFASYSRKDEGIVVEMERLVLALGDKYLRDQVDVRTGEAWKERLEELIREADIFQLFWSTNSMRSEFVRKEWEYALRLGRPGFVRATYWETPMPEDTERGLPPPELKELQFRPIGTVQVAPVGHVRRADPSDAYGGSLPADDTQQRRSSAPKAIRVESSEVPVDYRRGGAPVALVVALLVAALLIWVLLR